MTKLLFVCGVLAVAAWPQEAHAQSLSNGTYNPMPGTFAGGGVSMSGVVQSINIGTLAGGGGRFRHRRGQRRDRPAWRPA